MERLLLFREPSRLLSFLVNSDDEMSSSDDESNSDHEEEPEVIDLSSAHSRDSTPDQSTAGSSLPSVRHSAGDTDQTTSNKSAKDNQSASAPVGSEVDPEVNSSHNLPSGDDPYSFFLWSRAARAPRDLFLFQRALEDRLRPVTEQADASQPRRRNRNLVQPMHSVLRDLFYNFTHPRYKSQPRLIYWKQENNAGRGFIKEQCFSADGRLLISPYGNGVRLLSFDDQCRELSDCVPVSVDKPRSLHTLKQIMMHEKVVLTCAFSPTHSLFVTGGMDGSVAFLKPDS